MKLRNNWLYLVVLLVIASLFLVACERPLPGGYNDPDAGSDTTVPEVPQSVPGVDSEAYPADAEPAAPPEAPAADAEAYPADAAEAVEAYPAEEAAEDQAFTAEGEEAAPDAAQTEETTDAEASAEEAVEEPAAEGEAATEEDAAEEPAAEAGTAEETPGTHTVATGENLYRIGLLYGINWLDLAEANGIVDPANLTVGQVLTIPAAAEVVESEEAVEEVVEEVETTEAEATEEVAEEVEASEEAAEAEAIEESEVAEEDAQEAETAEGEEAATPATYIVQQGDTLFSIGVAVGVNWPEIVAANGIIGEQIYPGQELIIPGASDSADEAEAAEAEAGEVEAGEAEAVEPAGEETSYEVQEGDSVYSVAFEHGIPWTALVEVNQIEAPYTLELGQTLVIFVPVVE